MANLERKTAKVFGEGASTTGNDPEIGQFGSALAGTFNGTNNVDTIQALPAWNRGWVGAVTTTQNFPPLPEMTAVNYVNSYQTAYLLQHGIPEWDSNTEYVANTSFCQVNGVIYQSLTDNNVGNNPTTDTTNWQKFQDISGFVKSDNQVGSGTKPVYVSNGIINASNSTVGNNTQPVYMTNGNIVASNANIGGVNQPMYMANGIYTPITQNIGANAQPMYLNGGQMTASTASVGNSTTPVYMDGGTVSSTNLSIANDRFDGQWVAKTQTLSTATARGTYEIDLSDYLPDDNYNYEVLMYIQSWMPEANGSVNFYFSVNNYKFGIAMIDRYSKGAGTPFIIPLGNQRTLKYIIEGARNADGAILFAYFYRRIGTNV